VISGEPHQRCRPCIGAPVAHERNDFRLDSTPFQHPSIWGDDLLVGEVQRLNSAGGAGGDAGPTSLAQAALTWPLPSTRVMAVYGHTRRQSPQPTHLSRMTSAVAGEIVTSPLFNRRQHHRGRRARVRHRIRHILRALRTPREEDAVGVGLHRPQAWDAPRQTSRRPCG